MPSPQPLPQLRLGDLLQRGARHAACSVGDASVVPPCGMMKTTGTSSSMGGFLATTAASRKPATVRITCSTSEATTFSKAWSRRVSARSRRSQGTSRPAKGPAWPDDIGEAGMDSPYHGGRFVSSGDRRLEGQGWRAGRRVGNPARTTGTRMICRPDRACARSSSLDPRRNARHVFAFVMS